jgi:hypothetical protein
VTFDRDGAIRHHRCHNTNPARLEHPSLRSRRCRILAAPGPDPPLSLSITPGPKEKPNSGLESLRDDPDFVDAALMARLIAGVGALSAGTAASRSAIWIRSCS